MDAWMLSREFIMLNTSEDKTLKILNKALNQQLCKAQVEYPTSQKKITYRNLL